MTTAKSTHKAKMSKLRSSLSCVSLKTFRRIRGENIDLVKTLAPDCDMPVSVKIWNKLYDLGRTPKRLTRTYC